MCKAFSFVVDKAGKVYWEFTVDSHEDIKEMFDLRDDKMDLCPAEIIPKNMNYLEPDEWVFRFDEEQPDWWKTRYDARCWSAHRRWLKRLDKVLIKKPIVNPFRIKPPKITEKHIRLLREWSSIWDSIGDSIGDSIWDSIRDSIEDSIWVSISGSVMNSIEDSIWVSISGSVMNSIEDSIWVSISGSVMNSIRDSIWDSVRGSIWSYVGSFFRLKRSQWKHTENIKAKGYPFQPVVDLWEMGIVPSFDGTTWRLHGGKDAKILFQVISER